MMAKHHDLVYSPTAIKWFLMEHYISTNWLFVSNSSEMRLSVLFMLDPTYLEKTRSVLDIVSVRHAAIRWYIYTYLYIYICFTSCLHRRNDASALASCYSDKSFLSVLTGISTFHTIFNVNTRQANDVFMRLFAATLNKISIGFRVLTVSRVNQGHT